MFPILQMGSWTFLAHSTKWCGSYENGLHPCVGPSVRLSICLNIVNAITYEFSVGVPLMALWRDCMSVILTYMYFHGKRAIYFVKLCNELTQPNLVLSWSTWMGLHSGDLDLLSMSQLSNYFVLFYYSVDMATVK